MCIIEWIVKRIVNKYVLYEVIPICAIIVILLLVILVLCLSSCVFRKQLEYVFNKEIKYLLKNKPTNVILDEKGNPYMNQNEQKGTQPLSNIEVVIDWITRFCNISKRWCSKHSTKEAIENPVRALESTNKTNWVIILRLIFGILVWVFCVIVPWATQKWQLCKCLNIAVYAILLIALFLWIRDVTMNVIQQSLFPSADDFLDEKKEVRVVYSPARVVILGIINYFELIIYFAGLYTLFPNKLSSYQQGQIVWDSLWKGAYFSVSNQLLNVYGDIQPIGWMKIFACFQGFLGLLVLVLLIGQFVNALPRTISLEQARNRYQKENKVSSEKNECDPDATGAC